MGIVKGDLLLLSSEIVAGGCGCRIVSYVGLVKSCVMRFLQYLDCIQSDINAWNSFVCGISITSRSNDDVWNFVKLGPGGGDAVL